VSLAEGTFGKAVFCAFVTAIQRLICGVGPPLRKADGSLMFNTAGEPELVTMREMSKIWAADKRLLYIRGECNDHVVLHVGLVQDLPETSSRMCIAIFFCKSGDGMLQLDVEFTEEAAGAAMGLMLAICTGNPNATPAEWQTPLMTITLKPITRWGQAWKPPCSSMHYTCNGAATHVGLSLYGCVFMCVCVCV
jgi:hypothetical protein